ncbi:hypothetical protein AKJ37_01970 [candidate division MSBL1 archaeon SCGC-AAA259I09]|uniref:Uncharacterized protein n=2 Tax=candidate division MSBL1 TaxID=215777 RepID=A0A133UUV8_9EURY|nr:hypothetical protein AKJ62_03110 [candidate division MSBL1 archaeon SCGC-AAA259D14]KXA97916.1 hypothetical protein AKJ37_01970 [candidate division MSBL1 archaeon SCGC-AAA259I09]
MFFITQTIKNILMDIELIFSLIIPIATIIAVFFGYKSGRESQEKRDEKVEKKLGKTKSIDSQTYFVLRPLLSIPLGWTILSFIFSLNGVTIVQPYMVNSTPLWNWVVFLFVTFFVGMLVWIVGEKIYLRF